MICSSRLPLLVVAALSWSVPSTSAYTVMPNPQNVKPPSFRFVPWEALKDQEKAMAGEAGYEEKTWNKPGSNKLEHLCFESVSAKNEAAGNALAALGFSEESWDCFVNHYRDYDWDELEKYGVQKSFVALGWTEKAWEDGPEPDAEGKYWKDLTSTEHKAATELCFFQETWDEVAIPLWPRPVPKASSSSSSSSATAAKSETYEQKLYSEEDKASAAVAVEEESTGPQMHNTRNIQVPAFRYVPWDSLSKSASKAAAAAEYEEKTWNEPGTNKLENYPFEKVAAKNKDAQAALASLGFSKDQWDCYVNHYRGYKWRELKDLGVQKHYVALGWTEKSWDDYDDPPATDGVYWPDLTPHQQGAAYELCYFRETWDEVAINLWQTTAGLDDAASAASSPGTMWSSAVEKVGADIRLLVAAIVSVVGAVVVFLLLVKCCCCRRRPRRRLKNLDLEVQEFGNSRYTDNPDPEEGGRESDEEVVIV